MIRVLVVIAAIALAGCSDAPEKAAAITMFVNSCKTPVTGRMSMSSNSWTGNNIELTCSEFKPNVEGKSK